MFSVLLLYWFSHVERFNLTMRTNIRRFTRLINAHSKSLKHHVAMQNIFFARYNFCRNHSAIGMTPGIGGEAATTEGSNSERCKCLELEIPNTTLSSRNTIWQEDIPFVHNAIYTNGKNGVRATWDGDVCVANNDAARAYMRQR